MAELKEYVDINDEWHKQIDSIWPHADDLTFTKSTYLIAMPISIFSLSSELQRKVNTIFYKNIDPLIVLFEKTPTFKYRPVSAVGPITAFERQSSVCTLQGREDTCYAHSSAKIMLQNIYLFVNPINVQDKEKFHSCFDVLKTDIEHDYTNLSVEKCGIGYFKILLFLYLYFISKQAREATPDKIVMFEDMLPRVVRMHDIEQFKGKIKTNFDALRTRIQYKIQSQELIWDTFSIPCNPDTIPFLNNIISPILKLGFYIYVYIENPKFPIGHAVTLVKHRREGGINFFGISNSWGDEIDNTSDLTQITLRGNLFTTNRFEFILPFCKQYRYTSSLPIVLSIQSILDWIPRYERDILAFRSKSGGTKQRKTKKRKTKKHIKITFIKYGSRTRT